MKKNKLLIYTTTWFSKTQKNIYCMDPFMKSTRKGQKSSMVRKVKTKAASRGGSTGKEHERTLR